MAGWSHSANWNSVLAHFHGVNSPTGDDFKPCQHEVTDCGGPWEICLVYGGGHCWEQACDGSFLAEENGDLVEVGG